MRFALTQMNIVWENPLENQKICERLTKEASENGCEWIIFPEMTLTGFTMKPEQFHEEIDDNSPTCQFFRNLSLRYSIRIVYGYIAFANGRNYNHLVLEELGDTGLEYAKIHPFSYGEESKHYDGGDCICVSRCQSPALSSAICVSGFICYDLRFPEIFQKASKEATVIFVIANWPEARISHWYTLLQARAIENQCFILGVNRTGDGGGLHYVPSSAAFDPYGNLLTPKGSDAELLYADVAPELALKYRQEFPVKADRRESLY